MGKARTLAGTVSTGGPLEDGIIGQADVTGLQARIGTESSLGWRNRFINGDQRIDQRNNGAAVTINNTGPYITDRWTAYTDAGSATCQRVADAPAGFVNSLRWTVTGTAASGSSLIQQRIEGLNAADLAWGSASAVPVIITFWVKSSVTGTFGVVITNWSGTRASYAASYTINAANTWEFKTVSIPAATIGTWLTDNTQHSQVRWSLSSGSTSVAAGSWASGVDALGMTGQTNLMATNGATFQITGLQFEAGSVATPFERRDYGRELAMCKRYLPAFNLANGDALCMAAVNSSANFFAVIPFDVETRVPPTGVFATNGTYLTAYGSASHVSTSIAFGSASETCARLNVGTSGATAGQAVFLQANNNLVLYFNGCEL